MKFKGQVKIPELDSPGVPAVIVVEDPQAELIVEGESLGRWSLADVRAERLIANAFSLNLAGDEITFIADDPIDFAYGGVEEMANVWARYKTMTLPRRMMATSRSRKGTKPSRIGDLRLAIEETLAAPPAPAKLPGVVPQAVAPQPPPVSEQVPTAPPPDAVEPVADVDVAPAIEPPAEIPVAEPVEPAAAAVVDDAFEPLPPREPPRVISMGPTVKDSIFKDVVPWARKKEDGREAVPADEGVGPLPEPEVADVPEPEVAHVPEPEVADVPEPEERPAPPSVLEGEPEESVPWLEPSVSDRPGAPRHLEPAAAAPVESKPAPQAPEYIVDLGAFEHGEAASETKIGATPPDTNDRALEPAMAAPGERSGIMGAVRSAFVRNRDVHVHAYVSAPGGLGIVRNICSECGHISIGVTE